MIIKLKEYIENYYAGSVYEFSKEAKLYENPARAVWSHFTNRMIKYNCDINTANGEIIRTKDGAAYITCRCKEWRKTL